MSLPVHAVVIHRFSVTAERVFDACLDPAWVGRWMFNPDGRNEEVRRLSLEARVGGRFSFVVNRGGAEVECLGEYLYIDRPRLLVFTWSAGVGQPERSRVIIEFTPVDRGCDVKLTQVMGSHWFAEVDRTANVWSRMLDALERAIAKEEQALGV